MARVSVLTREAAQAAQGEPGARRLHQPQHLYRAIVRGLRPEQVGAVELETADRLTTERGRLRRAARAEGVDLVVRARDGNLLYFWLKAARPPGNADPADAELPAFLRNAPWDDELLTPEDEAAIDEGRAALARGDVVTLEALRVELGM